jgi:vacuolar-type H+-ATPase subunit I/STV1
LNLKVFALYSSFLRTRSMVVIRNQMVEEIAGLLILTGLFMIALSREPNESDRVNASRLKAFFISIYLNALFLITGILFTFGVAFIKMMTLYLFSWLVFYIIPFRILMYLDSKNEC